MRVSFPPLTHESLSLRRRLSGRWESGNPAFGFPLSHGPKFFFVSPGFESLSGNRRSCGNGGISPPWRDSQGAVERVGNLLLVFHSFHGSVISTALGRSAHHLGSAPSSPLQARSKLYFRWLIFPAYSVSLIRLAIRSNCSKLIPGLRNCSACGSDFSFS